MQKWTRPVVHRIASSNIILSGGKKASAAEGVACKTYHCHKGTSGCIRHTYVISHVSPP